MLLIGPSAYLTDCGPHARSGVSHDDISAGFYAFVVVTTAFGLVIVILVACLARSALRIRRDVRRVRRTTSPTLSPPLAPPPSSAPPASSLPVKRGSTTPTDEPPTEGRGLVAPQARVAPPVTGFHDVDLDAAGKDEDAQAPPPQYAAVEKHDQAS